MESAEVLTVGLNPSPGEFLNGRWPRQPLEAEPLACRLNDCFQCNHLSSHPWFEKWSGAISQLDKGWQYQTGQIAHIDLSPRATRIANQVRSPGVFAEMIQHDLGWLPDLLECAKCAKVLFIAGAVNRSKYIIEFLAKHGQDHDVLVTRRDDSRKRGFGFYDLHFRSRCLPVCFSGSGPSARDRGAKLVQNITDHRDTILKLSPAWACTR